jgi:hypothetical protein
MARTFSIGSNKESGCRGTTGIDRCTTSVSGYEAPA